MDSDFTTVPTAEFVSVLTETMSFGVFIVFYGVAVWILLCRWDGMKQDRILFMVSTLMIAVATAHLAIDIERSYRGFVLHHDDLAGITTFFTTHNTIFIVKFTLYVTQTVLGDSYMAYRIFILWDRKWLIPSFTTFLLAATTFIGYGSCYELTTITSTEYLATYRSPWLVAFLSLATIYNLLTMALIIFYVYRSKRRLHRYSVTPLNASRGIAETLVQSSAVYLVVLVSFWLTYIMGVNPEMFGVDILTPLIGIAFTSIIIRIELEKPGWMRRKMKPSRIRWKQETLPRDLVHGPGPSRATPPINVSKPRRSLSDLDGSTAEIGRNLLFAIERVVNRNERAVAVNNLDPYLGASDRQTEVV